MAEQKKERPMNELLTHSLVDIYVGPDSTHWPIHEKLLCYHSPYFASIFYDKNSNDRPGSPKSYGLPEEDDLPFEMLVGWLYSRAIKPPAEEKDIGPLLDMYLLADRFEMRRLADDVVNTVRDFYHSTSSYPGLRRVQYIYSNTAQDNAMREMMVSSVARYLTLSDSIPVHWANALKRNGQLALDIIRSIQEWHLESPSVPDARDASVDHGRMTNGAGFSAVEGNEDQDTPDGTEDDGEDEDGNCDKSSATSLDEPNGNEQDVDK